MKWATGKEADSFLKAVISECDDPQPVLASLKTKLVDQQEYLEHSKIFTSKIREVSSRAATPAFAQCGNAQIEFVSITPLMK